jgi:hypothetical protein
MLGNYERYALGGSRETAVVVLVRHKSDDPGRGVNAADALNRVEAAILGQVQVHPGNIRLRFAEACDGILRV